MATKTAREDAPGAVSEHLTLDDRVALLRYMLLMRGIEERAMNLYRTCVAGPDPHRAFCVFVNTDQSPPGVTRDPDQRPNAAVARSPR